MKKLYCCKNDACHHFGKKIEVDFEVHKGLYYFNCSPACEACHFFMDWNINEKDIEDIKNGDINLPFGLFKTEVGLVRVTLEDGAVKEVSVPRLANVLLESGKDYMKIIREQAGMIEDLKNSIGGIYNRCEAYKDSDDKGILISIRKECEQILKI